MPPAHAWLQSFAAALMRGDIRATAEQFAPECYWRDLVAFTGTIHTAEGREAIGRRVEACVPSTKPSAFKPLDWWTGDPANETWFRFETSAGRGVGHVRLREGRAWTLFTALRELHDRPEKPGVREPDLGVTRQPHVVIVGGGQGGIALAARLKHLGVPAIVLEKNARAGDSWRKRYESLVLHDPVWYDHLPYKPFPADWPVFMPKDMLADWLEKYVDEQGLDYWAGSPCHGASYDDERELWTVKTERNGAPVTLHPKHFVIATGMSGFPQLPKIAGLSWPPEKGAASATSGGLVAMHSSAYKSGSQWSGKKAVVLGASTSAHDICADLHKHGAEVTMVQRSPVIVATSESLKEFAWGRLYSPEAIAKGISTDLADLTVASVPFRVLPTLQKKVYEDIARKDAWLYEGLTRAGFLHDLGEDGSGLHTAYLRRGSGYYIEVGASKMIIDGKIKLRSGVGAERVEDRRVVLSDGSSLPADLLVCATGYGDMRQWAAQLVSPEVAEAVGPVWGLGSGTRYDPGPWEGELRNMWRPTRQRGLWFFGGNLMQARHYSRYLGLILGGTGK